MIVACVMCCAGLFGGCGQSGMKQDNTAISNSEEGKTIRLHAGNVLRGVFFVVRPAWA